MSATIVLFPKKAAAKETERDAAPCVDCGHPKDLHRGLHATPRYYGTGVCHTEVLMVKEYGPQTLAHRSCECKGFR